VENRISLAVLKDEENTVFHTYTSVAMEGVGIGMIRYGKSVWHFEVHSTGPTVTVAPKIGQRHRSAFDRGPLDVVEFGHQAGVCNSGSGRGEGNCGGGHKFENTLDLSSFSNDGQRRSAVDGPGEVDGIEPKQMAEELNMQRCNQLFRSCR